MTVEFFQHPQAICETTQVGPRTRIWAFAHLLPGARVGADCNICDGVFIENDVVIGDRVTIKNGVFLYDGLRVEDDVFIGPAVTFANDIFPRSRQRPAEFLKTIIRARASIGSNATLLPGIEIGEGAMIGAGAVVNRSVPPYAVVVGNPGRITGYAKDSPSNIVVRNQPVDDVAAKHVVRIKSIRDLRGNLTVGDFPADIPFMPKRYFTISGVPSQEVRGEHAHHVCEQFLVCLTGSCQAVLDNGTSRQEYLLDRRDVGLYIPRMTWGTQYKYSADAILLVFASEHYDPSDYIRNYDTFISLVRSSRVLAKVRPYFAGRIPAMLAMASMAAAVLITLAFSRYQTPLLTFHTNDAFNYHRAARNGTFFDLDGIRTYGYVGYLWLALKPFQLLNIATEWVSFRYAMLQLSLVAIVAYLFAACVARTAPIRTLIFAAIVLNPFLLALTPLTLTEVPSVLLLLIIYIARCRIRQPDARAAVVGIIAGFGVEMRPANLWLLAAAGLIICYDAWQENRSFAAIVRRSVVFAAGAIIPMIPQVIANVSIFHRFTPLPAADLGTMQLGWGKDWLKVGWIFRPPDQAFAIVANNPFVIAEGKPFYWMSANGAAFAFLKVVSFFVYDRLFVYQVEPSAMLSKLVVLMSSFTVYFGVSGLIRSRQSIGPYHYLPALSAILCVILYLPTALENRFSIQVFTILFPFALYRLIYLRKSLLFIGGFAFFFVASLAFSTLFLTLSPHFSVMTAQGAYYRQ